MDRRIEELLYAGGVGAWLDVASLSMLRFAHLWDRPMDAATVGDEGWRADVLGQAAVWDAVLATAEGAEVPAGLAAVDGRAVAVLRQLAAAGRLYRAAFLGGDASVVGAANDALAGAVAALDGVWADVRRQGW